MASDDEYGFEPKTGKSKFLRLKEKGDSVVVRIASPAYREPIVWKLGVSKPLAQEQTAKLSQAQWAGLMRDPDYNITEAYHWLVIDRDDGQARIFSGTAGIYKSIKEYAHMEQWGNPREYDLKITRTEEPGRNYYTVTPFPNKSTITEREKQLVDALNIPTEKPNASPTNELQIDDISEWLEQQEQGGGEPPAAAPPTSTPGYDSAKAKAKSIGTKAKEPTDEPPAGQDEIVTDFDPDEPINLDDITF